MKTQIQENGFEYDISRHRFGKPEQAGTFQFLLSFDIDMMLFDQTETINYRITDDQYIQFCCAGDNETEPRIVAQSKLKDGNLKEQINAILTDYFVGLLLFVGFPCQLRDSITYTDTEFKNLVQDAEDKYDRLKSEAKKNQ
jgi:hypothetical protein